MELESLQNNDIFCFFTTEKNDANFLLGKEKSTIHTYAPKRTEDFSTGRYCARRALKKLHIPPQEILMGPNKEPLWPKGIVGSISHSDNLTGAIVALNTNYKSIGLDIEKIGNVEKDLLDLLFTKIEINFLNLRKTEFDLYSTVLFSMKEAFYKLQYPITKTFLDFKDVEIEVIDNHFYLKISKEFPSKNLLPISNEIYFKIENNHVISYTMLKVLSLGTRDRT